MAPGVIAGLVCFGIAAAVVIIWLFYQKTAGSDGPAESAAGMIMLAIAAMLAIISIVILVYHFSGIHITQKGG